MRLNVQRILLTATFLASLYQTPTMADAIKAIDHGPIGVMGDHYHKAGEWMISARYMRMRMSGNQNDDRSLNDSEIISLDNAPGRMPAKLSVVPEDMDMDMLMLGAMYAPSDRVTLMAMVMASRRDMQLTSYAPPAMMGMSDGMSAGGRDLVGSFSTSSSDIEAISISGLFRLQETAQSRTHVTLGLQQSIADADAEDTVLTPMGTRMNMRLPYAMQIGDEALRANLAITRVHQAEDWVFGGQASAKFRLSSEQWHFGDSQQYTGWVQRSWSDTLSYSGRLTFERASALEGMDPRIMAPVQTAIPANYGYRQWRIGFGLNAIIPLLPGAPERLGVEIERPFDIHVNGVQMTPKWRLTVGLQKSL
jgi:hypothetical protein